MFSRVSRLENIEREKERDREREDSPEYGLSVDQVRSRDQRSFSIAA